MCVGGGGISTCVCWGVGWDKYMCVCWGVGWDKYMWIMTNKALKIPLICPHKSIYTAIVYNDLCIIMYLKQYNISLLHTHTQHAHTCISTQIHTVHMYIHM